jgi:hypothetical protein
MDEEMIKKLGLDPETIDGDYAEFLQIWHHNWTQKEVDREFFPITSNVNIKG